METTPLRDAEIAPPAPPPDVFQPSVLGYTRGPDGLDDEHRGPRPPADPWQLFVAGYHASGAPTVYLGQFVAVVLPCEAADWTGYYGANGYVSRAQFSLDTWAKVAAALARAGIPSDPDDPYAVGYGVGWWTSQIGHPGGRGGWGCWR